MEQTYSFVYEHYDSFDDMSAQDRELITRAREACRDSHAPYSGFRVGAAARLQSGVIITSSNQESEVFPAGVCAESNLLYNIQSNHNGDPITDFAIASMPADRECYPCGICRQVLADTEKRQGKPIRIIMSAQNSATVVNSALELLPFTFKL